MRAQAIQVYEDTIAQERREEEARIPRIRKAVLQAAEETFGEVPIGVAVETAWEIGNQRTTALVTFGDGTRLKARMQDGRMGGSCFQVDVWRVVRQCSKCQGEVLVGLVRSLVDIGAVLSRENPLCPTCMSTPQKQKTKLDLAREAFAHLLDALGVSFEISEIAE